MLCTILNKSREQHITNKYLAIYPYSTNYTSKMKKIYWTQLVKKDELVSNACI